MKNQTNSIFLVVAFIASLAFCGYLTVGFVGILFSVAFIGGFVFWLLTTYRIRIEPRAIIFPYLITVICFIIHVYEEYISHIELILSQLSGTEVSQGDFLFIAAFSAPIVWLVGAVMVLKRWAFGYFLMSTFLFGMMFGELSHFISPLLEGGSYHYSAGMYTAALPIVSAWWMFIRLRKEMRKSSLSASLKKYNCYDRF